jgi:acetyl esterase/lipase
MVGLQRWASLRAYGLVASALFGATTPPRAMRARFERWSTVPRERLRRKFPELVFEDHVAGELAIEAVRAVRAPARTILYLHGGAFVFGSPSSYRNRAMRLSYRCDAEVFVPGYRLAPEHPFPAALEDAFAAWDLVTRAQDRGPTLVAGDSAGGGLCLSLLLTLRDRGREMPGGAFLLSPWTDLTISGRSVDGNACRDLWFTRRHLETWAGYYVGRSDPRSPYLSPVLADLAGLPPLLLLVGEDELLLDDALRVAEAATGAGTAAQVHVGRGMQHDWPLTLPWLAESRLAWRSIREFVEAVAR